MIGESAATVEQPTFFYDLGDPDSYLLAEQISSALPVVPEWEPVLASAFDSSPRTVERDEIERLADELGLQPVRWPTNWPPDTKTAMLTATYAKRGGRAVAFSLAAFRQVFAAGRDLGDLDTVLIAAAACELHPAAVLKGIKLKSIHRALDAAIARALAVGVTALPAIQVGSRLFEGRQSLGEASSALAGSVP